MEPPDEEREIEERLSMEWKDFVAICIAVFGLLLPRLLATVAAVIIVAYLILWLWS